MKRTPLKRTGFKKRKTKLSMKDPWKKPRGKPLGHNPRRKKERRARYAKYMQSAEWKVIRIAAIERAGHQCEYTKANGELGIVRCPVRHHLTVHHKTYARFGGGELPGDLQVLCKPHHEEIEMLNHPTRHVNRKSAA